MAYQKLARRFKFLIESYRRHGFAHVREVFRWELARRRYARSPIGLPAPAAFYRLFPWFNDTHSFLRKFHERRAALLPFAFGRRTEGFAALLRELRPVGTVTPLIGSYARFEGLGVCINEPSGAFDWHRDYSSGKRWPQVPFHQIDFMSGDGADVKYVWELNRMHWIGWLGAEAITHGDGRHAATFDALTDDWAQANPVNIGVNWAMPMEVAIRAYWLVMGYGFFCDPARADLHRWTGYLRMLWGHGTYLASNLEYFSNLTNHYISNCFGLVVTGAFFADTAQGAAWLNDGVRRMVEELDHQVMPDGVHYERSIGYHRLVLEMYLIAAAFAERAGAPFPQQALARVERMAEFMRDYIPPHGTVPQFGDSDDGVILRTHMEQELYDHRDTMALAAVLFSRADFAAVAGRASEAVLWTLGLEGAGRFEALVPPEPPRSCLYREGGFAILRNGRVHVAVDAGPIGLHGNNDTLSFTLHGRAGAYLIDPGTYCYTRDAAMRNSLRSTRAHNTPTIDGMEIAAFDGLWRVREDRTETRVIDWRETEALVTLEAEHSAYAHLPGGGVTVRRRWVLSAGELRITDTFTGSGRHTVALRFTVPGSDRVRLLNDGTVVIAGDEAEGLEITFSAPARIGEGWYSPSYGVAAPATYIDVTAEIDLHSNAGPGAEMVYICRFLSHS